MNSKSKPLVCLFGRLEDNVVTFVGRFGYLEWSNKAELLVKILSYCNGQSTIKEIANAVECKTRLATSLLTDAAEFGIVSEGMRLYSQFHKDSANPASFSTGMSLQEALTLSNEPLRWPQGIDESQAPLQLDSNSFLDTRLGSLIIKRKTSRQYVPGTLSNADLSNLLLSLYSFTATPSAGNLRPFIPYVYLFEGTSLEVGLYFYRWPDNKLFRSKLQPSTAELKRSFPEEQLFVNPLCLIMLAADLDRIGRKYGNRGYRLTTLEAGHAAQNVYLWGAESGYGVLEYGGFLDEELARSLKLNEGYSVISTLFVGATGRNDDIDENSLQTLDRMLSEFGQKNKGKIRTELHNTPDQLSPRSYAVSTYHVSNENQQYFAGASGANMYEAQFKAVAEAVERIACSKVRVDLFAPANSLSRAWIDPRVAAPLTNVQYRRNSQLQPFDPGTYWEWVSGKRYRTQGMVMVPMDLVYFPINPTKFNRKLCCYASSSGVAAHTSYDLAVKNALLELIERDAFLRAWSGEKVYRFSTEGFEINPYVEAYRNRSVEVEFVRLDAKIPAVLSLMRSKYGRFCRFSSGSAATMDNWEEAASKAFYEAELGWCINPLIKGKEIPRSKEAVTDVEDHNNYYFNWSRQRVLNKFFFAEHAPLPERSAPLDQFDPVVVLLTKLRSLTVVRVIDPGLVPISFGYGLDHYSHHRIKEVVRKYGKVTNEPHCFA